MGFVSKKSLLSRFRRDKKGATAIEFAILILPFSMITFAILETAVSFTAQEIISHSVDKVSRQLRTGQITAASLSKTEFRELICEDLEILVSDGCPELEFDLKSYAAFKDVPTDIPKATPTSIDTAGFAYSPGGSGTINHLRVFYRWPIITDIMKGSLSTLDGNKTLLFASATWQNETY